MKCLTQYLVEDRRSVSIYRFGIEFQWGIAIKLKDTMQSWLLASGASLRVMSVFMLVLGVLSLRYLSTFKDKDLQMER